MLGVRVDAERLHVNAVVVARVADRSSRRSLTEQRVFSGQPVRDTTLQLLAVATESEVVVAVLQLLHLKYLLLSFRVLGGYGHGWWWW